MIHILSAVKGKVMKILIFCLSLFSVFTMFSCIPSRVLTIEKLDPAEMNIPAGLNSVLVLNASFYPSADTMAFNYAAKLKSNEQYIVDTLVNNSVFNGLFSILDSSPATYLNNASYYEARGEDREEILKPLSSESIYYLCDSFNVDGIIALEYWAFNPDIESNFYSDGDFFGTRASLSLNRYLLWRVYDREEGLVNEKFLHDTLTWYGYGTFSKDARDDLPELADALREAFWYAGYGFGKSISPSWEEENRSYFEIRNKKGEDISLNSGELKALASEGKKNKAYKASYNLAVFYEQNDDLEEAMTWINRAVYLRPEAEIALYYKHRLEKRISDAKALNEQLLP